MRTRAKHLLLDGVACALVGAQLPVSRRGVDAVVDLGDTGPASLVGWGDRTFSPMAAAMLNSSFIQSFELDDYHPVAPLHSNAVVLPAMLAALPSVGPVDGNALLRAAVLGYETGPRVGRALHGQQMLARGWHSGPVFGTHAAAVAAGSLYGLGPEGFEDALGMAATQSGGLMSAQFESMVKRMQHGFAARNGLVAAALARKRYVGIKRVFEREYGGYLAVFGEGHDPDPRQVYAGLGDTWETDAIAVKPYAAMGGLHAAIDAALDFRAAGVHPDDISAIEIDVSEAGYGHGGWRATRPIETIGAQMNLAYAFAVALLDGSVLIKQFRDDRLQADDVWQLIDRTTLRHEPAFDDRPADEWITTRVKLRTADGRSQERLVVHPRGTGDNPTTNEQVVAKYRALTSDVLAAERRDEIEDMVLNLEELEDTRELFALLTPHVAGALD